MTYNSVTRLIQQRNNEYKIGIARGATRLYSLRVYLDYHHREYLYPEYNSLAESGTPSGVARISE